MRLTYEVNGLVMPSRIGGHPALDLSNTYVGWADPPHSPGRGDYLLGFQHLAQWVAEAQLVDPGSTAALRREGERHPRLAARVLARTVALRTDLHHVITEPAGTRTHTAALAAIADAARVATERSQLVAGKGWQSAGLESPWHACALAAVDLLARIPLSQVHACPGDGCGWLFWDPSGRRRWCRMEWCGNRIKQRAHAARARQSRSPRS